MQSQIIALMAGEGPGETTLLVRRGNGQFSLERIDARVAHAARLASVYAPAPIPVFASAPVDSSAQMFMVKS